MIRPAAGRRTGRIRPTGSRPALCEQVPDTDRFTDCDGRELSVSDLADPVGVCVEVADRETLSINLRCDTAAAG